MLKDDDDPGVAVLGNKDGEAWLATQARVAARMAIINADASDKLKRAAVRRAPTVTDDLCTGTRVYFYSTHPFKGRQRRDAHCWRGPATIVARESPGRYFVAWKTKLLLVSKEQLRLATMEEAKAFDEIASDIKLTGQNREEWAYVDVTPQVEGQEPEAGREEGGLGWRRGRACAGGSTSGGSPSRAIQEDEDTGTSRYASRNAEVGE